GSALIRWGAGPTNGADVRDGAVWQNLELQSHGTFDVGFPRCQRQVVVPALVDDLIDAFGVSRRPTLLVSGDDIARLARYACHACREAKEPSDDEPFSHAPPYCHSRRIIWRFPAPRAHLKRPVRRKRTIASCTSRRSIRKEWP